MKKNHSILLLARLIPSFGQTTVALLPDPPQAEFNVQQGNSLRITGTVEATGFYDGNLESQFFLKEARSELEKVIEGLGLKRKGVFTEITQSGDLLLDKVTHTARIEVNEKEWWLLE